MPVRASRVPVAVLAAFVATGAARAAAPPAPDPAAGARAVLTRHCARCHGEQARPKGGLGKITDVSGLLDRGQVVPGDPAGSPLFERVASGEMPPYGSRPRFSRADADVLRRWIAGGAAVSARGAGAVPEVDLLPAVRADLEAQPARDRPFLRYLSAAHLGGRPAAERLAVRHALAKLVNSLSWHARLSLPRALAGGGVYRVDLRHYRWTARQWDRLAAAYPYAAREPGAAARRVMALTGAERPVVRVDWFIATASRPPAYHDLLGLPTTDRALERLVRVEAAADLEEGTAVRAGFNGSGVARANRVIERHDAAHGAYWRSFDFSDNTGRQNAFAHPLGPAPGPAGFRHAGGEIVFHLPNGLQGYLIVDADGRRIDRAPGDVVGDPKRPDRLVENGLSCMGCHVQGVIPKDDQVRAHALSNPRAFSAEARDEVLALYAPPRRMKRLVREDNERFAAALRGLGVPAGEPEPISAAVLRFEETVSLARAADELGVGVDRLAERLRGGGDLGRTLGPLRTRGSVQRQVFEEAFARLLEADGEAAPPATPPAAAARGPFRGHRGTVGALAWAADGNRFASADADGEVRVWDLATGRSRVVGRHADEVHALAFSPDGKRLLSGGADRAVALWDVATGKRLARLVGHTAAVRAVAFAPGGGWAVSGGADRSLRLWDLGALRQSRAVAGHAGTVTAVAVSPDGKTLLSGSADRTARLWRASDGAAAGRFDHAAEVQAVAFSADGRRFAAAGVDRTVWVRSADTGETVRRMIDLADTAVAVAFGDGGRQVVSVSRKASAGGACVQRHTVADGRRAGGGGPAAVEAAAVAPDGRVLVAVGAEVRLAPVR